MSSDRLDDLIRDRLSPDGQVLSLKAQFIREVGAKALAKKEELKNLRALDLTQNDIGDEGVKWISQSQNFSMGTSYLDLEVLKSHFQSGIEPSPRRMRSGSLSHFQKVRQGTRAAH